MDQLSLQDEKISHLKEQIMMWKIRASSAEERVTRLLQMREREIKESHEERLKIGNEKEEQGSSSVQDDSLPPEITLARRGRRARLSDTLALLTDPKWEADPDPDAEWIVLKIPKGNDSYFLADFVDGDKEDEKEWLEGPFQQRWSVDYLVGLKRMQRSERRERSNYLRANEGKSMGRKKMTRRKEAGSVESMKRSIAPNTTQWPNLRSDPEERYTAAVRRNYPALESPTESDDEQHTKWMLNSGKRVSIEEVFSGERRRLERAAKDLEGDESRNVNMSSPGHLTSSRTIKESPGDRPKSHQRKRQRDEDQPMFFIGNEVGFCDNRTRVSGAGFITKIIRPGEKGNPYHSHLGLFDPDAEILYEIDSIAATTPGREGWVRESMMWKTKGSGRSGVTALPVSRSKTLHPMNHVGVDTCSAASVSSEIADFLYLDESVEARNSISLNGVGQGGPEVMGRGPLIVSTLDSKGNQVFMWDPAGVLIRGGENQARMRILGQQRMKRFGFNVVQDYATNKDHLNYRDKINIPLTETNGILMIETQPWLITDERLAMLESLVEQSIEDTTRDHCYQITENKSPTHHEVDPCPVLIINEAKLTKEERDRLDHWRHAHRSSTGERFKERCHTCEQAKHKATYKRNEFYHGTTTSTNQPYFRLYADGYGGQHSMGSESYQGGIGGFVFACPVSGRIKAKLYSTQEQFPAALYQVLQEIETEGYVCRELYVDTYAVNISAAAEEVASMFKMKIIPISGGTPQELAFAESAVRTLGQMSRAQMIGAPHLPPMMWGLSDLYAAHVHMTLPQKGKQGRTPHEITTGRIPDRDVLFIHVFGCPCQYAPANVPDHKRAPKTEWGWFVGVQWPMVLILRPFDNKVISISRKKVHCHEMMYAKFDAEYQSRPRIEFKDFTLDKEEIETAFRKAEAVLRTYPNLDKEINDEKKSIHFNDKISNIPDHVLSIKALSDCKRNADLNKEQTAPIPEDLHTKFNAPHQDPGEECEIPAQLRINKDLLLEEIAKFKSLLGDQNLTDKIKKALRIVEDETTNLAPGRNSMRKKDKPIKEPVKATLGKRDSRARVTITQDENNKKSRLLKVKIAVPDLEEGDRVKIRTFRFGSAYAKGRPRFTYGNVVSLDGGKIIDVRWDNDEGEPEVMKTKLSDLKRVSPVLRIVSQILSETTECGWPIRKVEAMFPILEVGSQLTDSDVNTNGNWPRDFIEALIRPDWRLWVEAVKSENDSWELFEATIEIPYRDIQKGASVIPLGELFTIKRSGKYKFRQIALGNLLKEGKDYGETFATTVSGDGLRWFCSLAVTCGKEIKGWDATTGYLQTVQRVPVYAYLPSHHGFSCLEYEELAKFRTQLLEVLKDDGIKGIKDFSKKLRQERRVRPDTVLELKRSVYGIPDAGQSFSMFMQSLHMKKCQMVQSDMDPCVFYKIYESEKDEHGNGSVVTDYLIAITWVDDCRYFGTSALVSEYEKVIGENCKCTFEGKSTEFVSIKIDHDLAKGTLELTQQDYWEKAIIRFKEFLPKTGPKERLVPLSPSDERLLIEPTEEEIKAGEHLPYPNVLGVVQYPSNFTKMEMRYAMSVLSRHRTKWGIAHFKILLKALEYGWSTRVMGVKYNGNLDLKLRNVLIAFADSSFSTPRSQGCRIVMMNGGAISFTSKKHTTTDDSTTAAELTEAYLCACDVEGFRNLNEEIGLKQDGPTILYQDNQSAIQIAMNRGSLSKKTRAMEIRTLTLRNKVEDMKVVPIYLETDKMLADLGTKALDPKPFVPLRDRICGYVKSWF
jgi:hypothetical protein